MTESQRRRGEDLVHNLRSVLDKRLPARAGSGVPDQVVQVGQDPLLGVQDARLLQHPVVRHPQTAARHRRRAPEVGALLHHESSKAPTSGGDGTQQAGTRAHDDDVVMVVPTRRSVHSHASLKGSAERGLPNSLPGGRQSEPSANGDASGSPPVRGLVRRRRAGGRGGQAPAPHALGVPAPGSAGQEHHSGHRRQHLSAL